MIIFLIIWPNILVPPMVPNNRQFKPVSKSFQPNRTDERFARRDDTSSRRDDTSSRRDDRSSSRKGPAQTTVKHQRQKPQTPPPLVLPSDVRRSSHSGSPYSRSASSSPSPTSSSTHLSNPQHMQHRRSPSSVSLPQSRETSLSANFGSVGGVKQQQQQKLPASRLGQRRPTSPATIDSASYKRMSASSDSLALANRQFEQHFTGSADDRPQQKLVQRPPIPQMSAVPVPPPSPSFVSAAPVSESPPVPEPQADTSKKTFGSRLKKALFGSKNLDKGSATSPVVQQDSFTQQRERSNTMTSTSTTTTFKRGRIHTTAASVRSVIVPSNSKKQSGDFDTTSLMSVSSTSSAVSFATLRKVSRAIFKRNGKESVIQGDGSAASSVGAGVAAPFAENSRLSVISHSAEPVVTHSVAEAELPSVSDLVPNDLGAADPKSNNNLPTVNVEGPLEDSRADTTDDDSNGPIPSLSSSTESTAPSEPIADDEAITAGETLFPKKLDSLTVETIRTSLERTKSLERRRSRRSTRSTKSSSSDTNLAEEDPANAVDEDASFETVVNPTKVHIHEDPTSVSEISKDTVPSRSILKASTSASSLSTVKPDLDDSNDSGSVQSSPKLNAVSPSALPDGRLIDFDIEPDLRLDFNLDSLKDAIPDYDGSRDYYDPDKQFPNDVDPFAASSSVVAPPKSVDVPTTALETSPVSTLR